VLARNDREFTAAHKAALALADVVMTTPARIGEELVSELRAHFTEAQLIELTLDIMKWNAQKVPVALGTDVWLKPGVLTDLVFDDEGNWIR
jgi:alkylhydroperoxidase family enzyme